MKEITATFDADTKRYHRFLIDEGQDVMGSLYIAKTGKVPDEIVIRLRTKADSSPGKESDG